MAHFVPSEHLPTLVSIIGCFVKLMLLLFLACVIAWFPIGCVRSGELLWTHWQMAQEDLIRLKHSVAANCFRVETPGQKL